MQCAGPKTTPVHCIAFPTWVGVAANRPRAMLACVPEAIVVKEHVVQRAAGTSYRCELNGSMRKSYNACNR